MQFRRWCCVGLLSAVALWCVGCICTDTMETVRIEMDARNTNPDGPPRSTAESFEVAVIHDEDTSIPDDTIELFDSSDKPVEMVANEQFIGRRQLNGNCEQNHTIFTPAEPLERGVYKVVHREGSAGMPLQNEGHWTTYDGSVVYLLEVEIIDPEWEDPTPPDELEHYITGDDPVADVKPGGPSLLLMGGGLDVDEAFETWLEHVDGGDVVVLRTSGGDGYNDYLYHDLGGINSVETMLVNSRHLAEHPYVVTRLQQAEGIFLAGGNQTTYLQSWRDTNVAEEIEAAYERGANVGGTSAGLAVLGEFVFSAEEGSVYSDEALEDPYNQYMTFEADFVSLPSLSDVIFDSHFADRDRFGRLMGFLARQAIDEERTDLVGIGVDERTAFVIEPDGQAAVMGEGAVYVLQNRDGEPTQCVPGQWLETAVDRYKLSAGDTVTIPSWETDVESVPVEASQGQLSPASPYD